jgi:hypothetical protein
VKLLIDTKSTVFLAGGAPAPVVDYETKRPKLDQASGEPLYAVQVIDLRASPARRDHGVLHPSVAVRAARQGAGARHRHGLPFASEPHSASGRG